MSLNKIKSAMYSSLALVSASAIGFAQSGEGLDRIRIAAGCMCYQLMQVLPVVSMLMIIGAGVVYAAGQMMGAETRARANTWATAMLIGAVIGILIVVVAPNVLSIMYANNSTEISNTLCDSCPTP